MMLESKALRVWFGATLLTCALLSGEALCAQDKQTSVPAASDDGAYHIGVGDVLQIDVWKEPKITRTIPVRPDGKITLPLLNDVQAAGLTPVQLAGSIREGLTKFLTNPQVTVTVTQIKGRSPLKGSGLTRELRTPDSQPSPDLKQKCCVA
jgi:polysaccharide biosynthesis/export protein